MSSLRVIFMGTPDFSVPTLQKIMEAGHEVVAVYSQPPSRAGRGKKERLSPVHSYAQSQGIPVHTPKSLKSAEEQDIFAAYQADLAVVVAYGLLLPKPILDAPKHGCFNLHGSLLPRWRGAAPIQRALMAGDTQSGVMVMQMEEGLDTGPFCMTYQCSLTENMTAGMLHDDLMANGAALMVEALSGLMAGTLAFEVQSEQGATYAKKIQKSESKIGWDQSALDIHNHIRGLSPFPGAWFEVQVNDKTERIKLLQSTLVDTDGLEPQKAGSVTVSNDKKLPLIIWCAEGAIAPVQVQRAGKKPANIGDFVRGFKMPEQLLG